VSESKPKPPELRKPTTKFEVSLAKIVAELTAKKVEEPSGGINLRHIGSRALRIALNLDPNERAEIDAAHRLAARLLGLALSSEVEDQSTGVMAAHLDEPTGILTKLFAYRSTEGLLRIHTEQFTFDNSEPESLICSDAVINGSGFEVTPSILLLPEGWQQEICAVAMKALSSGDVLPLEHGVVSSATIKVGDYTD
jgi:hypothetical protein